MMAMRHYLTEQEFAQTLLHITQFTDGEIDIDCETDDGKVEHIRFRATCFFFPIILYSLPFTNDIGLIQEDDEGWDQPLHEVWMDITDQCGWRPFINV